jgi:hypothetical protein
VDPPALRAAHRIVERLRPPAGGTFADGVSRTAYSDADVAGRRYVMAR